MGNKNTNPIQEIVKPLSDLLIKFVPFFSPDTKVISGLVILMTLCSILILYVFNCSLSAFLIVMTAILIASFIILFMAHYFEQQRRHDAQIIDACKEMQKSLEGLNVNSVEEIFSVIKKIMEKFLQTITPSEKSKLQEVMDKLNNRLRILPHMTENFFISREAEIWLRNNQRDFVKKAIENFLKEHAELKNPGRSLDSDERTKEFEKSIDKHIEWILKLLSLGTDKIPLNENPVIPERFAYKEIFEHLRNEVKKNKKLSAEAKEAVMGRLEILIKRFGD